VRKVVVLLALLVSACGIRAEPLAMTPPPPWTPPTTTRSRPASTQPTSPPPSSPPAATCPEPGVVIKTGAVDGAAGLRVMNVEMTNCGTKPFKVKGYPSLRVLDKDKQPITVTVSKGSTAVSRIDEFEVAPKQLTLQPGEKAISGLVWRNLVTDSTVKATQGFYLDIAPLTGQPSQVITYTSGNPGAPTPEMMIDLGNTTKLGTQAWTKP
jgi:hypothetical protein